MSWGYDDLNGPSTWMSKYPAACGSKQSPINIESNKVKQERQYIFKRPLSFSYYPNNSKNRITNTGASWQVNVDGPGSVIQGGPLGNDTYELLQFHCHWGKQDDKGSEHTVNGRPYAAEIHFVHWNKSMFISAEEAAKNYTGLAVTGVFFELGSENKELNKICRSLENISLKGQESELRECVDPTLMFPKDRTYWCYEGSLTTPPCHESVTWILFKTPVEVSWEQLQTFRQLNSSAVCLPKVEQIMHNNRPVQPIGARIVKEFPDW